MLTMTLAALAETTPHLRRFAERGFELARPVLDLEIEFEIETVNQTFIVNRQTPEFRPVPRY